jgi:hypothetical protein
MGMHLCQSGGLLLLLAVGNGGPALGQSPTVADGADSGVILRPADGERVPPF